MNMLRTASRLVFAALLAIPATGCGHLPMTAAPTYGAESRVDFSGAETMGTHKRRSPKKANEEGQGSLDKFLANAAFEAKSPAAYILSAESAEFLKAEYSQADSQRQQLAKRIAGDSSVSSAFASWDSQSDDNKMAALKQIANLEGQVMGFTVPPMNTKSGVPADGTMAFFAGARDGVGSVTLFTEAIAKGDKFAAIATVTHEMRHAYQFQLVQKAAKKKLAQGSTDMALAIGFYQADKAIGAAGGEDNFSYGDYCHLNNEWDAFATGNMVAAIVSQGKANTSGLGFVDVQYKADGTPYLPLSALVAKVGAAKLLDAVNQVEIKIAQASHNGGAAKGNAGNAAPKRKSA
jgi:hypothetical protein